MSLAVSSATCLPPLRCALGQGPLPSPHRQYLPSFSSISGVVKRERSIDSPEDEDALPLLMSMAQIQTKAAMESRLPTISSILPSLHTTFGASTSQFSQMAPATPSDRASSSSSPVPQSSPPSPSTLSPGLFGSSSLITTSSASSTSFGAASSRLIPSTASHQQQAYVSATNSLMELSDIISSTPALHQKLPVPLSAPEAEAPSEDSGDDNDADNEYSVDSDGHPTCSSPVSSRTRRVTRSQQRQIERIRSEIERERERARELERTLHLALRERSELLAGKRAQVGGLSFVNVLNATEDGSQPQQPQQMFVDLPTGTQSLPSLSGGEPPRPSSEGRSRSAPMLPPIGSIPALSPYLARKRGSLPSSAALSASSATTSPSSSPLRSAAPEPAAAHARAQLSRRRKSVDREDDEDYAPTAAAKKIKRSRSMSEGGRRLQASSTRRRRSESQYQSRDLGGEDDHAGQVAAAFMAMRAKAIEEERRARESRLMMDVVEGADQEGDGDDDEDDECHHTQHRQSRVASGAHARRDSLLDFIKDHPHASFWLKARN